MRIPYPWLRWRHLQREVRVFWRKFLEIKDQAKFQAVWEKSACMQGKVGSHRLMVSRTSKNCNSQNRKARKRETGNKRTSSSNRVSNKMCVGSKDKTGPQEKRVHPWHAGLTEHKVRPARYPTFSRREVRALILMEPHPLPGTLQGVKQRCILWQGEDSNQEAQVHLVLRHFCYAKRFVNPWVLGLRRTWGGGMGKVRLEQMSVSQQCQRGCQEESDKTSVNLETWRGVRTKLVFF